MLLKSALFVWLAGITVPVHALPSSGEFCVTKRASTSHSGSIPHTTTTYTRTDHSTKTVTSTVSVLVTQSPSTTVTTKYTIVTSTVTGKKATDTSTATSTVDQTNTLTSTATETVYTFTDVEITSTDISFPPIKSTLPTTAGALEKRGLEDVERRNPENGSYPASVRCVSYTVVHPTKTVTATKTGTAKRPVLTSTATATRTATSTVLPSHAKTTITTTTTSIVYYTPTTTVTSYTNTNTYYTYVPGPTPNPVCNEDNYVYMVGDQRIVSLEVNDLTIWTTESGVDKELCCNNCYNDPKCFTSIYGPLNYGSSENVCGLYYEYSVTYPCHVGTDPGVGHITVDGTAVVQGYNPDGSIPPYYQQYGNYTLSNGFCVTVDDIRAVSADCCE